MTPKSKPRRTKSNCKWILPIACDGGYIPPVAAPKKPDNRQFKAGDKIRVNLHSGKTEDAVVRAVT
jgi:hypothetical protein